MARRIQLEEPADTANRLHAHILLDRSGSMANMADDAIGAFNDYRQRLAEDQPDARLSLTIFDGNSIDTIVNDVVVGDVPLLTRDTYQPRGSTPLYDSITHAVGLLDAVSQGRKALVILTDGGDTGNRTATKESVRLLLENRQEMQNWLVLFLGANQDAFAEGGQIGTSGGTTMNFSANGAGLRGATMSAYASTIRYASSGSLADAAFTDEERADAE